ncbi:MAG: dTMP kinase [Thermoplasmata archaeon]|nr:MAG: dTMP kinase [Thermoplasmata archaeon]
MADLKRGVLITIEGIDGVGKTTQTKLLTEYLREKDYRVVQLREPTDGFWGKKIKNLTKHGRTASPKEECQWFLNDRKEDVEKNINPALSQGKIVIMDRYYYSTIAYQGALGLNTEKIREENEKFAPKPDMVIILDAPPKVGLDRITDKRKEELNYFETLEYQEKVRALFLSMKNYDNVRILDGSKNVEEIQGDIRRVVEELINIIG